MLLFDVLKDALGIPSNAKEFDDYLQAKDISSLKTAFRDANREEQIMQAIKEYNTKTHDVMYREDKIITDKAGRILRKEPVWKLPIPYPVYINEISVVFLYGRPVKWALQSSDTEEAFQAFMDVIDKTRFNAKIRQCKRLAGAETQSAMLFRVFQKDGKPDVQIRVLARSKGDEIYVKRDKYENIISMAWGYWAKVDKEVVYHFDVFTPKVIYHCRKKAVGWDIDEEINYIGKIPIILFEQPKEWAGVENLIHREEFIASRSADTNDYFSDPIAIMNADVIKNMPEKKEAAKMLITNDKDGVNNAAKYLTWDSAPESKRLELEWLQERILSMTFTPKISLDTLKSLSNLSAKALRTVMLLADIKANKHKEQHDELLSRTASLITAIVGNVLNVSLRSQCDNLKVLAEFQEPFGEDVSEDLTNLIKAVDGGIISRESSIEMNPLINDVVREKERIETESQQRAEAENAIFGMGAGSVNM